MTLLYITLIIAAIWTQAAYLAGAKVPGLPRRLTLPARKIVREYNDLPKDARPFPNVKSVLRGLDEQHELDRGRVKNHFMQHGYTDYYFSWTTCYRGHDCRFEDYAKIHRSIEEVNSAVDAKKRALLESRTSGNGEAVRELLDRLDVERQINREFVQDFKALDTGR